MTRSIRTDVCDPVKTLLPSGITRQRVPVSTDAMYTSSACLDTMHSSQGSEMGLGHRHFPSRKVTSKKVSSVSS